MQFEKIHGCGNDFIVINNLDKKIDLSQEEIARLCNRHFGIGSDGLILVEKDGQDYFMNYFNADGTTAEMCGNGMRCTADFIRRNILEDQEDIVVGSRSGKHKISFDNNDISVTLDKGRPIEIDREKLRSELEKLPIELNKDIGFISMGNPHMIILVNSLKDFPIDEIGPFFERNKIFENGINVNFTQIKDDNNIEVVTWERGDGRTLACGTGACATVTFLNDLGLVADNVDVKVPGGKLNIELTDDNIIMTGPAVKVYSGTIED